MKLYFIFVRVSSAQSYLLANPQGFWYKLRPYMIQPGALIMSRICQITGKKPVSGCNVSHAHNKTKRRFEPNLQKRRIWVPSEKRYITLKVSARGLRIIDKLGIEKALEKGVKTNGK